MLLAEQTGQGAKQHVRAKATNHAEEILKAAPRSLSSQSTNATEAKSTSRTEVSGHWRPQLGLPNRGVHAAIRYS